jgi:hypothetical protein
MKKLLLLLTLSAAFFAAAQDKTTFGINAGLTFSDLRGDGYAEDFNYGVNYLVGLSLEAPINERLSFVANLNYEKKSSRQTIETYQDPGSGQVPDPNDPAFSDFKIKASTILHYITVPLNLKYYIGGKKNFFVTGGAYAAVLVNDTYRFDGNKVDNSGDGGFLTFDYGLTLGLVKKLKLTETQNLNIELRENLGLPLIMDDNLIGKTRINSINLIVNWPFSL